MVAEPVTITFEGAVLSASTSAYVQRGTVVGPLSPFLDRIAGEYTIEAGSVVIEGAGRRIVVHLGDRAGTVDGPFSGERPIEFAVAPEVRNGVIVVPIAAIARALGYEARFEPSNEPVLALERGAATPIGTAGPETSPPGPYETFSPQPVATRARPLPSLVPRPRRTPAVLRDDSAGVP